MDESGRSDVPVGPTFTVASEQAGKPDAGRVGYIDRYQSGINPGELIGRLGKLVLIESAITIFGIRMMMIPGKRPNSRGLHNATYNIEECERNMECINAVSSASKTPQKRGDDGDCDGDCDGECDRE
jgi:hypothetical protein